LASTSAAAHELILDATVYAPDQPPPALIYSEDDLFLVPRASLFVDAALGEHVALHGQVRADRGFDPRSDDDVDVRADEYFLDVELIAPGRLGFRLGKFATTFGTWVKRHVVTDNAFVSAPLLYEDVMPVTDDAAPPSAAVFANRRNLSDNKPDWVSIVWGPSYSTGIAMFAATDTFDLTIEVKNAAVSSRPDTWDVIDDGLATDPTFTARASWRPILEWTFGVSASAGPWMQDDAERSLPPGDGVDEYQQTTIGVDLTYEHYDLQIWSELVFATFEVPRVGDVDVTSGYIEGRYKLAPQYWVAVRLNQSSFDDVPSLDVPWDRDVTRLDMAVGYAIDQNAEIKLEYSVGEQDGRDTNGDHVFMLQAVYRFGS
jgi:hypothetical protein